MKKIEIKTQIKENCYKIVNKKLKQNLQEAIVLEESWDEILKNIGDVSQYVAAGALLIPKVGPLISRIASGAAVAAHTTRALTPDTSHPGRVEGRSQAVMDAIVSGLPFAGRGFSRKLFKATRHIPKNFGGSIHPTIGGQSVPGMLQRGIRRGTMWFSGQRVIPGGPGGTTRIGYDPQGSAIKPYDIVTTAIAPVAIERANLFGPRSERKTVYKGGQTREEIRSKEIGTKPIDWGSVANTLAYTLPFAYPMLKGMVFKK